MDEAKVPYSAFGRLKGRAQAWFSKPANTILLIFLIALIVLTLYPLLSLLMETIMIHPGREARAANAAARSRAKEAKASNEARKASGEALFTPLEVSDTVIVFDKEGK